MRRAALDHWQVTALEIPVSVEEFEAHKAAGLYALDWAAHGTLYAIPKAALDAALAAGKRCVLNVSRSGPGPPGAVEDHSRSTQ
jgi:ribose 1,5-bisphosphokinase PhnN